MSPSTVARRFYFCRTVSSFPFPFLFFRYSAICVLFLNYPSLFLSLMAYLNPNHLGALTGGLVQRCRANHQSPAPYALVQYIDRYGARLDGCGFDAMHLAGHVKEIRDVRTGCMDDTAVGAWIKR